MEPFRNKEDCIINGRVPGPVKAKIEVTSLQLDHGRVHIRLDAGNVPEFWLEMNICATALLDLIKPNEEDNDASMDNTLDDAGEPNETKDCVLCGGICELYGNNPHPLANDGLCCDDCNLNKVVPARLAWMERYGDGFTPYFDPAAVTGTV